MAARVADHPAAADVARDGQLDQAGDRDTGAVGGSDQLSQVEAARERLQATAVSASAQAPVLVDRDVAELPRGT